MHSDNGGVGFTSYTYLMFSEPRWGCREQHIWKPNELCSFIDPAISFGLSYLPLGPSYLLSSIFMPPFTSPLLISPLISALFTITACFLKACYCMAQRLVEPVLPLFLFFYTGLFRCVSVVLAIVTETDGTHQLLVLHTLVYNDIHIAVAQTNILLVA